MRAVPTLTAIGAALWMTATSAHAMGFGRVTNATQLGQPLNFAAAVRFDPDEVLPRECVSAEVQSGDSRLQPGQIRATLEGSARASDRMVRVTTSTLIDEPVVTISVTLGCTTKVTRKFVAFIDPPLINAAQTAPIDTLPPQRVDSQVAPIVTMVQGDDAPVRRAAPAAPADERRARPRPPARATATAAARAPERARKPRRPIATRAPRVARAAPTGARLQLEAAAPIVARKAAAPAAAAAPAMPVAAAEPASAAPVDAGAQALEQERVRIRSLEAGMAKLQSDSQATQAALAALQLRLKVAESERYANPLVYALAWLSALLALAVAALWWRQSRVRQSVSWWTGPVSVAAGAAPAPAAEPVVSAPQPLDSPQTAADAFEVSTVIDEEEPLPPVQAPARPASFGAFALAPAPAAQPPEGPRELSVEELIDLEQQAEFFVVLGQDEAAIDLLMSHVRSDGGISPLPYLKLLEIYRRRGDHDAYQRIRERFNRRFNAYAPDWDADLQQGRTLADYPDTIERLQSLWATPARAMETLDASLFRRNKADETFDLPAYRELLFLYSIARDLAEHGGALPAPRVDLLLPLDDPGEVPISRLTATTRPAEFQHSDLMTMPLDLDVSFGPGTTQELETMPSSPRRSGEAPLSTDSNFLDFDLGAPAKPPKAGNR